MKEESVDSKRDLEEALRTACNDFIEHTCTGLAPNVMKIVEKVQMTTLEGKKKEPLLQALKVKDALVQVAETLESSSSDVTAQMSLYLDNPATQSILLKPIAKKISKGLDEIRKVASEIEDDVNGWDETIRGEIFMCLDDVDKKLKKSLKAVSR